jgi:hypothetical protein
MQLVISERRLAFVMLGFVCKPVQAIPGDRVILEMQEIPGTTVILEIMEQVGQEEQVAFLEILAA